MDAVKCLYEFQRMCESHICCKNCKINSLKDNWLCKDWSLSHPEELVRIVEEWSIAHPIVTNGDKLQEVFKDNFPYFFSDDLYICIDREWFDQPYVAPKEK